MTGEANSMTVPGVIDNAGVDHEGATRHRKMLLGEVDLAAWEERLQRFMSNQPGFSGKVAIGNMVIAAAGGSSGTILFDVSHDAANGDRVTRGAVLRHATEGGLFHSYNLAGQYSVIETLQGSGVIVPGLMGVDPDGAIIGVPAYVMSRVDGEAPPTAYNNHGVLKDADPVQRRAMLRDVLGNLARLHAVDISAPGLAFLDQRGEGQTPAERDINWFWASAGWGCPEALEELAPVRRWLIDNQPAGMPISLCHGDAMLPNYMFRDGKVVAVIDWEMAFFGNPAHDVVYQYLAHKLLSLGSVPLEGLPGEEEWRADYEEISGKELVNWEYCAAETAYRLHIALLLVYRETAPGMEAARDAVLGYTRQTMIDRLEVAKRAVV